MSTEQKYPAEIVEAVSAAILANFNAPDERHSSWWINPDVAAVAALDALGLTVTEEYGLDFEDELDGPMNRDEALLAHVEASLHPDQDLYAHRFVGRHVLHAETPWVEVVSDGE